MVIQDQIKLIKYSGYRLLPNNETVYELYDLGNDSEELINLVSQSPLVLKTLKTKMNEVQALVDEVRL